MEPQQPEAQAQNQQAVSKERMTEFFQHLRTRGLTAMMDFSCCSACGMWEVDDVRNPTDTGYVFYNRQSALKIQETGEVTLSFGTYPEVGAHTTQQIGQIVADEAERVGMPIDWDGRGNTRIMLANLDKSDFSMPFEIILEYPPEVLGGERTAVVRTDDGRTLLRSFTNTELKHTCGNGRFPCKGATGPCLHLL